MTGQPVLFLDHAAGLGGAEHSLLLILRGLDNPIWRPILGCVPGSLSDAAASIPIESVILDFPRLRRSSRFIPDWLRGTHHIACVAKEMGAALIYSNTVRATVYGAPAAALAKIPFVWHMRDFWLSESTPRFPLIDKLGKFLLCIPTKRVIANSNAVAIQIPCGKKTSVVPNGIDLDRFTAGGNGKKFREQYRIPLGVPVVGTVGRLRPWKGQACFLQVAAKIIGKYPEAHFLVVGGSPFGVRDDYAAGLHLLADELGLSDIVTFTGHLDDVRPAFEAMDIFVHPGEPEPFGLVNIEAMAMEKPVIAYAHGGLTEIVIDRETGYLITPGDEMAFARAILKLLESPKRRVAFGLAGRARVNANFTATRTAKEIEEILLRIMD